MEIAVTQVVADRELMFSHTCQHRPNRVPKGVPAHAKDADARKSRLDLLFENGGKVQRLLPFAAKGRSRWTLPPFSKRRSSRLLRASASLAWAGTPFGTRLGRCWQVWENINSRSATTCVTAISM